MKSSRSLTLAISTTALVALVAVDVRPASAQTLFDLLFKNRNRREVQVEPEPQRTVRRTVPKVSGPQYYTYKTDPLVRVDFAAIKPDRTDDAALHVPAGTGGPAPALLQFAQLAEDGVASDATPEHLIEEPTQAETPAATGQAAGAADSDEIERAPLADAKPRQAEPAGASDELLDAAGKAIAGTAEKKIEPEPAAPAATGSPQQASRPAVESEDDEPAAVAEQPAATQPAAAAARAASPESVPTSEPKDGEPASIAEKPAAERPAASGTVASPKPAKPAPTETTAAPAEAKPEQPVERAEEAPVDGAPAPAEVVQEQQPPAPLTDEQIAALQTHELLAEQGTAAAIVAHYTAVPKLIWVADGAPNDKARAALDVLGDARTHGLNPDDYAVAVPASSDDAALAAFEMELSARLLRYMRDARSGRIDPNRISGYHEFAAEPFDQVAALQLLRTSDDVAALLEAQHPRNQRYEALRVELEMLRASAEDEIVVAPRTLIRPGETNPELSKILALIGQRGDDAFRAEFGALLDQHAGALTYVPELVPVVKAAQKAAGVGVDGVIGPRTIHAIAGESKAGKIAKVEAALERLRWLPSDLGDRHVFINAAAFNAAYVEDGREKLSMRTVVGGLSTQTYFFQDEIDYVEFHPYWGVPRSILVNKYLPKLLNDPSYLDRSGFEVVNSRGQRVSSSSVNWGAYGANIPFDVRQRPGASNALGELKIMFPNRHAIYMHDTPEKHLFDRENRALSNGCVRLQDPRGMAAAVLGWERARLAARLDQPHSRQDLATKVPVYVTYFTAWPDEAGKVNYFGDIYSRDEKLREASAKVEALRAPGA